MLNGRRTRFFTVVVAVAMFFSACGSLSTMKSNDSSTMAADTAAIRAEAQSFLDAYTETYVKLYTASSEAEWQANIKIVEGDTTRAAAAIAAKNNMAAFTGSVENIEAARKYLATADLLTPIQVKQFKKILYVAANNPQTVPELVKQRIAAETELNNVLYGFDFQINGKSVSTNEIDDILKTNWDDLEYRKAAWEASKEVGNAIKPGLVEAVNLRNATVQALGYDNFFQYMVSEYGMTSEELIDMVDQFNRELRPLYRELHTWARYTLAERFGQPVPDEIPAHWLPNRWGQDWSSMITVAGMDLNGALADKDPEFLVKSAENFYVSLGYPKLPETFYTLSSLYPLPNDAGYKKNNHASAWHMDLNNDLRSLMSVEPNAEWWETVHHEFGHIYYYIAYTNDDTPPLLRRGANRSYHEAIGSLLGIASMQKPFLQHVGLIDSSAEVDPIQSQLREALSTVVFIPWSAGVMSHFEHDLYDGLDPAQYNERWWQFKTEFQGIVPPEDWGIEGHFDGGSKTHITDDPAGYYDYAISYILLFHLHDYIASEILHQDPHETNYFGNKEVGDFIWSILSQGAKADWRTLLKEKTGSDLSAKAMLDYYQPLMEWLQKENEGRTYTLPEIAEAE